MLMKKINECDKVLTGKNNSSPKIRAPQNASIFVLNQGLRFTLMLFVSNYLSPADSCVLAPRYQGLQPWGQRGRGLRAVA